MRCVAPIHGAWAGVASRRAHLRLPSPRARSTPSWPRRQPGGRRATRSFARADPDRHGGGGVRAAGSRRRRSGVGRADPRDRGEHQRSRRSSTARGANLIYARRRPGAAGREAARVPAQRRRDQPADRSSRSSGTEARPPRLPHDPPRLPQRGADRRAPPPAGCGNYRRGVRDSPPTCTINARMELLDGRSESTVVDVDRANSIENRLNKAARVPRGDRTRREGWAQFLDGQRRARVAADGDRRRVARRRPGRDHRRASTRCTAPPCCTAGRTPSTAG